MTQEFAKRAKTTERISSVNSRTMKVGAKQAAEQLGLFEKLRGPSSAWAAVKTLRLGSLSDGDFFNSYGITKDEARQLNEVMYLEHSLEEYKPQSQSSSITVVGTKQAVDELGLLHKLRSTYNAMAAVKTLRLGSLSDEDFLNRYRITKEEARELSNLLYQDGLEDYKPKINEVQFSIDNVQHPQES